jgi:hypothetical protein
VWLISHPIIAPQIQNKTAVGFTMLSCLYWHDYHNLPARPCQAKKKKKENQAISRGPESLLPGFISFSFCLDAPSQGGYDVCGGVQWDTVRKKINLP